MKTLSILLPSFLLTSFVFPQQINEPTYAYANDFDLVEFPPLEDEPINIKVNVSFSSADSIKRVYDFTIYFTGHNEVITLFRKFSGARENSFAFDFTTPYPNENAYVSLDITDIGGTILLTKSFIAYAASYEHIWPENEGLIYDTKQTFFVYKHSDGKFYHSDSFEFLNYYHDYTVDYQRIDYSKFRFRYTVHYDVLFKYSSVKATIINIDGLYSDFGSLSADGQMCNFELLLNYDPNNYDYYLTLKGKAYVDPNDLTMHNEPKDGYIETNKLYIPYSYPLDLNYSSTGFNIYDAGINNIIISMPLTLSLGNNLLGNCAYSTYCVTTEASTPNFDIGKVVEN